MSNPIFTVSIDCYEDLSINIWSQKKERLTGSQEDYLREIKHLVKKLREDKPNLFFQSTYDDNHSLSK